MSLTGISRLVRTPTSIAVGAIAAAISIKQGRAIEPALVSAATFSVIAACGFAANDLLDIERDRVNKPWRAIPAGLVTRRSALVVTVVAGLIAVSLARTSSDFVWHLIALVGVLAYPLIVVYLPLAKGFVSAALSLIPIACAMHWDAAIGSPSTMFLLAGFIFLLGREIVMDAADLEGDLLTSVRTIPIVAGVRPALFAAAAAQLLAAAMLSTVTGNSIGWLSVALVSATGLTTLAAGRFSRQPIALRAFAISMWIPMLLGVAAFQIAA